MRKSLVFGIVLVLLTLAWPVLFGFGLVMGIGSLLAQESYESASEYEYVRGDESSNNKILKVDISGVIWNTRGDLEDSFEGLFGDLGTYGYEVKEMLMEASKDESVLGVVLEVNSPGGTVTGSKAIADGVEYFKQKTGKPVLGFGSGLVASGAYWSIIAADEVVVDYGSLVGSVGVIGGQFPVYNGVTELGGGLLGGSVTTEGGIDVVTITSGEGKDFGNPFRQPTNKELSIAQESSDLIYERFVDYVSVRRGIENVSVRNEVGAYAYGEEQALNLGLIDRVGSREEAYRLMAEKLGIEDYQVVGEVGESDFVSRLLGVVGRFSSPNVKSGSCIWDKKVMVFYGSVGELCE